MPRRVNVPSRPERVVLSEVLPYEVPPTFSNRHLYRFLVDFRVNLSEGQLEWVSGNRAADTAVRLLAGIDPKTAAAKSRPRRIATPVSSKSYTIPFSFRVAKSNGESRTLSVCHPRNQIWMVSFYEAYKDQMLYFTNRSTYSIRHPSRVSSYMRHDDRLHAELKATWTGGVQQATSEDVSFRSYFTYMDYSNIYKFYESAEYQALEKRYRHLMKLDVTKCFDSIYTHSAAWAIFGKHPVKEHVKRRGQQTFPEAFDQLMQKLNYNETNGIIVGPEFSRIFAEVILQAADRAIATRLGDSGILQGQHYEIRRYVDDFFVFYDRPNDADKMKEAVQLELERYGLFLNTEKEADDSNPNISPISVAKGRAARLLGDPTRSSSAGATSPDIFTLSSRVRARELITAYKTIVKESGVVEADILNYSLALVESSSVRLMKLYAASKVTPEETTRFIKNLIAVVHFAFFIYAASPKVNPTVKLCRIVNNIIEFVENHPFDTDVRRSLFDEVFVSIRQQLAKAHSSEHVQVENLYLLTTLGTLGRDYLVPLPQLLKYFGIRSVAGRAFEYGFELNHFAITTLLHYIQERKRYSCLRTSLEEHVEARVKALHAESAERPMLILDFITCPHVSMKSKNRVLLEAGIVSKHERKRLIEFRSAWFTKWVNFDLGAELDLKRNQEVY